MPTAQEIWTKARINPRDRAKPPAGYRAVLLSLDKYDALRGSEVARVAAQSQSNVTTVWLPKMAKMGFVDYVEDHDYTSTHGGRTALLWRLTRSGKTLVRAIKQESNCG
jgi:Mn-dependent DtxR family transcriptional regulator